MSPRASGEGAERADQGRASGDNANSNHRDRGYRPWQSDDFGFGVPLGIYNSAPDTSSQSQTQAKVLDIAPAVARASYAEAECTRTYTNLMLMIDRARKDFQTSADYRSAQNELNDAQAVYEDAMTRVVDQLKNDPTYKKLIEQRTEQDLAMENTAAFSGRRNTVATQKMDFGSQASLMEADALARDTAFQNGKTRLLAAKQSLWRRQADFDSSLYARPELLATKQSYEQALSNKAGAEGYLRGAEIARGDQLDINAASFSNSFNSVVYTPFDSPYYRGYHGVGWPF
jgi:hypothetical protein